VIYLPDQDRTIDVDPPIERFDEDHILVPVVRRANFSFDGRINQVQSGTIAMGVDAAPWRSGSFVFVTHARNSWITSGGANAVFAVQARSVSLEEEDPDKSFIDESRIVASGTITAVTQVPNCSVSVLEPPFGPQLLVRWTWSQGATAASVPLTLACSVYLLGRKG